MSDSKVVPSEKLNLLSGILVNTWLGLRVFLFGITFHLPGAFILLLVMSFLSSTEIVCTIAMNPLCQFNLVSIVSNCYELPYTT